MLKLYNTLTKTKEIFSPLHPPVVTYYSCGPTVYDYAHIGHARTYVFADVLQRVLVDAGYTVQRVMNITDVGHLTSDGDEGDDKMEKGAQKEKKTVWEIADYYTKDFFSFIDALGITRPETITKATEYIPQMIDLIRILEKKGYTYVISDGVYFDTSTFLQYGKLTGYTFSDLQQMVKAGARIEMIQGKRHPTDFALWKFSDIAQQRQMEWESPWGRGFPGWHIECSAMAMHHLGDTIDIHTGGIDHVPIHHTNEIAQSEAATGRSFVSYWLHGEHLLIDGKKMSKSLGNIYRQKDIEAKGYHLFALRYLFLTASYRKQMNFTWESLAGASHAWEALAQIAHRVSQGGKSKKMHTDHIQEMRDALWDDLGTAQMIGLLWEIAKSDRSDEEKHACFIWADEVLGLGIYHRSIKTPIPEEVHILAKKRDTLRKEKKWEEADEVRKKMHDLGYDIQDTLQGAEIYPITER